MKPLDGLLVVAIEQAVAAPLCTARLCEAGARVIKIERPGGDFARGYDTVAAGDSSYFLWINQGKESLLLDFKHPDDARLLHRILGQADIMVQNLAPGALQRAGFGSDELRNQYPQLITCDISGFGNQETVTAMKAYDFLVQGETGLVSISGGINEIGRIGISICDIGAGMTAHAGILEALIHRNNTGRGSGVQVSLFDVTADWMTVPLLHHDYGGQAPGRAGLHHPSIAPYGGYQTADGNIVIIAIQNEREWQRFCAQVLDQPAATISAEFGCNNARVQNRDALDAMINQVIGKLSRPELIVKLQQADIAYGSVNSIADFSTHPALQRTTARSSSGLPVRLPARPIRHSSSTSESLNDTDSPPAVPALGQQSEQIRQEFSDE